MSAHEPASPSPATLRATQERLEGIHELPAVEQIDRYRALHDELAARLAAERD
nr:hypothetical protein [Actinomycetales bacterium]